VKSHVRGPPPSPCAPSACLLQPHSCRPNTIAKASAFPVVHSSTLDLSPRLPTAVIGSKRDQKRAVCSTIDNRDHSREEGKQGERRRPSRDPRLQPLKSHDLQLRVLPKHRGAVLQQHIGSVHPVPRRIPCCREGQTSQLRSPGEPRPSRESLLWRQTWQETSGGKGEGGREGENI
jgi:hypothetical protein